MRLPISASSFGRICGGFEIRNDLLTFFTETLGISMAQMSHLSSATNGMQHAGQARSVLSDALTVMQHPVAETKQGERILT
jgi:hypothetical protein